MEVARDLLELEVQGRFIRICKGNRLRACYRSRVDKATAGTASLVVGERTRIAAVDDGGLDLTRLPLRMRLDTQRRRLVKE